MKLTHEEIQQAVVEYLRARLPQLKVSPDMVDMHLGRISEGTQDKVQADILVDLDDLNPPANPAH